MTLPTTRTLLAAALTVGLATLPVHAGGNHGPEGHGHDHGPRAHSHRPAPPDPNQAHARYGGVVLADGERLFEVEIRDVGIRVHPMNAAGEPRDVAGLSGKVLLKSRRGRRMSLTLTAREAGSFLEAAKDLSSVKDGSRSVILTVNGLPEEPKSTTLFTRFDRSKVSRPDRDGAAHRPDHGHRHEPPKPHNAHGHSHGGGHGHDH